MTHHWYQSDYRRRLKRPLSELLVLSSFHLIRVFNQMQPELLKYLTVVIPELKNYMVQRYMRKQKDTTWLEKWDHYSIP